MFGNIYEYHYHINVYFRHAYTTPHITVFIWNRFLKHKNANKSILCITRRRKIPLRCHHLRSADVTIVNNSNYDTAFRQNQGSQVRYVTGLCVYPGNTAMLQRWGCVDADETCLLLGVAVHFSLPQRDILYFAASKWVLRFINFTYPVPDIGKKEYILTFVLL
jgi:hypothetical protein